jgi:hypothetical protein
MCAIYMVKEPLVDQPTRKKDLLRPPLSRIQMVENGPLCQCMILYNELPEYLKRVSNFNIFRNQSKKFFIENCFYSDKEYLPRYFTAGATLVDRNPFDGLYAPCHKKCPIFLLFQRQTTDSFCGREHTIYLYVCTTNDNV